MEIQASTQSRGSHVKSQDFTNGSCSWRPPHSPEDTIECPRIFRGLPLYRVLHTTQRISWEVADSPIDFLFTGHSHWPEDLVGSPQAFIKIRFHGYLCTAHSMPVEFPEFPMDFLFTEASTQSTGG